MLLEQNREIRRNSISFKYYKIKFSFDFMIL